MLIRSQDKNFIVTLENMNSIGIHEPDINAYGNKSEWTIMSEKGEEAYYTLGEYSTEEKAMKVLDMIATKFSNIEWQKWAGCKNTPDYKFVSSTFLMPQDDEVK